MYFYREFHSVVLTPSNSYYLVHQCEVSLKHARKHTLESEVWTHKESRLKYTVHGPRVPRVHCRSIRWYNHERTVMLLHKLQSLDGNAVDKIKMEAIYAVISIPIRNCSVVLSHRSKYLLSQASRQRRLFVRDVADEWHWERTTDLQTAMSIEHWVAQR